MPPTNNKLDTSTQMADRDFNSSSGPRSRRDRSWLLPTVKLNPSDITPYDILLTRPPPQNRKLRHLHGISLRNLTFVDPSHNPRGTSTDDEVLSQSWRSPTKELALRESPKLEHSRSSTDLPIRSSSTRKAGKRGLIADTRTDSADETRKKDKHARRPSAGKLRRRSTLNWTGASQSVRQKKLEDVIGARMGDSFFSLHIEGQKEPIYISEVVSQAMVCYATRWDAVPSSRLYSLS
jgi:hypothetical protein